MSEKTQQIIELVRIKSWYVPRNLDTYRILRQLKVPLLKIHRDFLPALKLVTGPRNIRAKSTDFTEILNKRLDMIGAQWKSKPGRTCRLTEKRLLLAAPCSDANRRAIASLEASFAKFCSRWGYKTSPIYSERDDRLRLVVDFEFDPSRNPIIESEPVETTRPFELVLGNTKFKVTFMDKPTSLSGGRNMPPIILFETFTKAGSDWKLANTGTCVDLELGDPSEFIVAMSILMDRRRVADDGGSYQPWAPIPDSTRTEVLEELRALTVEAETNLFKMAQAPAHQERDQWMAKLGTAGRKVPRLAIKLKAAHVDLVLTRQMLLAHINSPKSLYPFFLQKEMGYLFLGADGKPVDMSPADIEARSTEIWPMVQRVKAAWISAESKDTEGQVKKLKKLVAPASQNPKSPSVSDQ